MIYLDNNATTPVAPEVLEAMLPFLKNAFGNPSSAHGAGREVRAAVERSRGQVADLLGAGSSREIVFTSCGTESDNWAIYGAAEANPDKRHIVTTRVEHEAVRKPIARLETKGYRVTWLDVDENGALDLDQLHASLTDDTALVSIMMANNETGVLFPAAEIGEIVKERSNALFHVDGVNAAGKVPVRLKEWNIDLFSISAHKFYGPKGVGALFIREEIVLPSFILGGGQENSRRAGTEAVHQIAGMGKAAEIVADLAPMEKARALRDRLEFAILDGIAYASVNGRSDSSSRLPNTSNISFEGLNGEAIMASLNDAGIYVSTGSACHSTSHEGSSVLQAMNVPYSRAMGSIRFSLGRSNTEAEIDAVVNEVHRITAELRAISAAV